MHETGDASLQHWLNTPTTNPPLHTQREQALHITLAGFH
ncbi:hypothetical protein BZL30_7044 [Mycobacterium kansasii]|uniref:Uncharacterized protein n=1 Tax=Mycobacterium kansasii TaxID=1768 RepID=A0A1V3WPB8_MYCKA|nr:hypothetical protein BZL30_7044 [Mycobacterium kansasii]